MTSTAPQKALAALDRALERDPTDAFAYNGEGWALNQLQQPEQALAA
jgi:Flp pilus assembly protein TadD